MANNDKCPICGIEECEIKMNPGPEDFYLVLCKRCDNYILKNERCASIPIPGQMGSKTYCLSCFKEIIEKTMGDLENYKEILNGGQ